MIQPTNGRPIIFPIVPSSQWRGPIWTPTGGDHTREKSSSLRKTDRATPPPDRPSEKASPAYCLRYHRHKKFSKWLPSTDRPLPVVWCALVSLLEVWLRWIYQIIGKIKKSLYTKKKKKGVGFSLTGQGPMCVPGYMMGRPAELTTFKIVIVSLPPVESYAENSTSFANSNSK